jgi:AcrR family transcriptional regulator
MNESSSVEGTARPLGRTPTRRALAKQQTRTKVLVAGRRLFSEQGYEGATIRDIATAAGMSTGAVFANFTDKSDLFREIMTEDMTELASAMRQAVEGDVEAALLGVFMTGYRFYQSRLQLARAAFSVSWDREGGALRSLAGAISFASIFQDILAAAAARGELSEDQMGSLRAEMLYDAYLSNFRQAIFGGWTLEALQARSQDQIRLLLAGARRG